MALCSCGGASDFYPRSPCGERRSADCNYRNVRPISIHALLAESDRLPTALRTPHQRFLSTLSLRRATIRATKRTHIRSNFYPRSPCGERRSSSWSATATSQHFYPRSPCGERRSFSITVMMSTRFLSTLSLRRATFSSCRPDEPSGISIHALLAESDRWLWLCLPLFDNFYPRSPCGERLLKR